MLEFDIWTIAFSIINILVLFLFLKKFLFGRIQNIMDQRAAAVQADLDQAKASKEEAHQLRQQYEDTLSGAKQEASTIIANARTAAKEQGNQITEQAQQEASRTAEYLGWCTKGNCRLGTRCCCKVGRRKNGRCRKPESC